MGKTSLRGTGTVYNHAPKVIDAVNINGHYVDPQTIALMTKRLISFGLFAGAVVFWFTSFF